MFLNISSSMGSFLAAAERMARYEGRLPVYDRLRIGRSDGNSCVKNSIDNESNSPQYLGVTSLYLLQLGNEFESGPPSREKCSRRKLHASKEKGCQEKETLTVRETTLRRNKVQENLLREAPLQGFFVDFYTSR